MDRKLVGFFGKLSPLPLRQVEGGGGVLSLFGLNSDSHGPQWLSGELRKAPRNVDAQVNGILA